MPASAPHAYWQTAFAHLLSEQSPADALTTYYAFHHPTDRTEIFAHQTAAQNRADGFLIRARTGMDLFRPLVTFRAETEATARELFRNGLVASRPYYLVAPENLSGWIDKFLIATEAETYKIYQYIRPSVSPPINVLLISSQGPDGTPRAEIRSAANKAGAVAGVNWISPRWAEVFVHTDAAVRGRGWGKAVVAAVAQRLVAQGRTPLYVTSNTNDYSMRLAEAVGFVDTGYREFVGQVTRSGEE